MQFHYSSYCRLIGISGLTVSKIIINNNMLRSHVCVFYTIARLEKVWSCVDPMECATVIEPAQRARTSELKCRFCLYVCMFICHQPTAVSAHASPHNAQT